MESNPRFTHIFSSDLERALKTANAIQSWHNAAQPESKIEVTALKILREQDFGYYEGKPFFARPRNAFKSGKEHHRSQHIDDPHFQDVESRDSMSKRMDSFLQDHLVPLILPMSGSEQTTIAIVSHGIILSQLWRCVLQLLPKDSVTLSPTVDAGRITSLEHLGGWSNTGYLELDIRKRSRSTTSNNNKSSASPRSPEKGASTSSADLALHSHKVVIKTVNGKAHLQGLKRTKGGIGSAQVDEGQKSIDSFFKKRKIEKG